VDALLKAGAKDSGGVPPPPAASPAASPRAAVARSLPLLQRTDVTFMRKSGCVSCHNNSLTAMTVALARQRALPVDEPTARAQLKKIDTYLDDWRERALQGVGIPGDSDTVGYILMGLAAEKHPPDRATDAMARYVRLQQSGDGSWKIFAHRPPIESSDIEVTVSALRSLQVYAPASERTLADASIERGVAWLTKARPVTVEDRAFQLLGFAWNTVDKPAVQTAAKALAADQRPDGGWSQLPSLQSDAYATGQALVALAESGGLPVTDPVFTRGVAFLMKTQLADGSWLVRTRALPIQPQFDAEFPHGRDQFISSAATNWATQALLYAAPKKGT
jgi:hypothetical protein